MILTQGSIPKALTLVALPIMATSFIQMAYNLVDMAWIGRLGATSVAAVGIGGMYLWLSNGLALLPKIGALSYVGKMRGKNDLQSAETYASLALFLAGLLGLAFCLVMEAFTPFWVDLFHLSNVDTIQQARLYLRIVSLGLPFTFINMVYAGILSANAQSQLSFKISSLGLIANMILDPVLIFSLHMNVAGAALATTLAQVFVTLAFTLQLKPPIVKPDMTKMVEIAHVGLPAALQSMVYTLISMTITRFVASFGDQFVAVQNIGSQIESINWMIAGGFGDALSAFLAQNAGANQFDRIHKGYRIGLFMVTIWTIGTTALLFFGAGFLFSLFLSDPVVLPHGVAYLQILAVSQIFMCWELASLGAFNGLGHTRISSSLAAIGVVLRIPLGLALSVYFGAYGLWMAVTISSILKGISLVSWYLIFERRHLC